MTATNTEQRYEFDTQEAFLERLEAMAHEGVNWENVTTLTPFIFMKWSTS